MPGAEAKPTFGEYLKSRMAVQGYSTLVALSAATAAAPGGAVAASTLSNLASDKVPPGYDVLRKLALALGVTFGELQIAAGLATAEELGLDRPAMPAQYQSIEDYARDHHLSARRTRALRNIAAGAPQIYEDVVAILNRPAPEDVVPRKRKARG